MYWAQALAAQTEDPELAARFGPVAEACCANEKKPSPKSYWLAQGEPVDLGGYYHAR
jgi:isocitrate dehydrogenase